MKPDAKLMAAIISAVDAYLEEERGPSRSTAQSNPTTSQTKWKPVEQQ